MDGPEEKKVVLKKEGLPLCLRSVLLHFQDSCAVDGQVSRLSQRETRKVTLNRFLLSFR